MINLGSAYGEIQIGTEDAERKTKSLAETMRSVGTGMSLAITTPLAAIAGTSLKAAAGFEQSMNQIQVISSATGQQMNELQAQALQLGKDTVFSAGEAADGFLELSKSGFTVEQSMAAIGGVLDLASAGGLSVASAAEIASNAINSFQRPASDASKIANLLAAGANASSVEVTDLADSLRQSGAVMNTYGQSIENTVTALGILGNAGLKGSDAGTSLKQMFLSLAAPTDKAGKLMNSLGIKIYDANGAMLPFEGILNQVRNGLTGMTEEQRNAAMATIFGSDAVRAANILLQAGTDGWDAMAKAVTKAGSAQEVAQARQKGLSGAIEYFRGTMESLLISYWLPFLDSLGNAIRWIADLASAFSNLPRSIQAAAFAFIAVLVAAGPVLLLFSTLGAVLGAILSPIGLVIGAIGALAAAWASDFGGIQEKTKAAWDVIVPIFQTAWDWLQTNLVAALGFLQAKWAEIWPTLQGYVSTMWGVVQPIFETVKTWVESTLTEGIKKLQSAWETAWPAIQLAVQTAWSTILGVFALVGGWVALVIPAGLRVLQGAWSTAWEALQTAASAVWKVLEPILTSIGDWASTTLPLAIPALQKAWDGLWPAMQSATSNAWKIIQPAIDGIGKWVQKNMPDSLPNLKSLWSTTWQTIQTSAKAGWDQISPLLQEAYDWVQTNLPNALPALQTAWTNAWAAIRTGTRSALDAIQPYLDAVVEWVQTNLPQALPALQTAWANAWTAVRTAVNQAWEVIQPKLEQIRQFFEQDFPKAMQTSSSSSNKPLEEMSTKTNQTIEAIQHAWQGLIDWFEPIVSRFGASFSKLAEYFGTLGPQFQTAWDAIQPVIRYIEVAFGGLLLFLGVVVAGIIALFINIGTAIMDGVQPIVSGFLDFITGTFQAISDGWKGTVDLIDALVKGDFSAAWAAAKAIVTATGTLFMAVWALVWGVISGILTAIGSLVRSVMEDMGIDVDGALSSLQKNWDETWGKVKSGFLIVAAVLIATFSTIRQWLFWTLPSAAKDLYTKFQDTWTSIKNFLVNDIFGPIISTFTSVKTWLDRTLRDAFTNFKNFIGGIHIPNPFSGLLDAINSVISGFQSISTWIKESTGWNLGGVGGGNAPSSDNTGGGGGGGFGSQADQVTGSSAGLVGPGGRGGSLSLAGAAGPSTGLTVNITTGPVNSRLDVADIVDELVRQIRFRI